MTVLFITIESLTTAPSSIVTPEPITELYIRPYTSVPSPTMLFSINVLSATY